MPYSFMFDLSSGPARLVFNILGREPVKRVVDLLIQVGLDVSSAARLAADLAEIEALNCYWRRMFEASRRRALFLPHCSRPEGCGASFAASTPSYQCRGCRSGCAVRAAKEAAEERGYSVYIIPGGSCIPKIIREGGYDGVVGVACPEELLSAAKMLAKMGVPGQAVPLLRNGCANTVFSLEALKAVL